MPPSAAPGIAVIVPVLNEAGTIEGQLAALRGQGFAEILVVDGGSTDVTADLVRAAGGPVRLIEAARGRAAQMNAGARAARAGVLLFLHADTRLPDNAAARIRVALHAGRPWGRFDVRLDGAHPLLRAVEFLMNWRSALTGVCTGDQALFVERAVFESLGGYAAIPIMEDIELTRRLKRIARPARIREPVVTSARRWRQRGVVRTILSMWRLRLLYRLGVPAERLARHYPEVRA